MKIRIPSSKARQGSIILATVLVSVVVAGTLATYLLTVSHENTLVARAQAWNNALVVAEGGIEEGMAMINVNGSSASDVTTWPSSATANKWYASGNAYSKTNHVGSTANYYIVTITNNPGANSAVIKSVGFVLWNLSGFGGGSNIVSRAVLVTNSAGSVGFSGGILVKKGINMSGNVLIDGFNSQDPLLSTNGHYILSKHNAGVVVATVESNVIGAIDSPSGSSKIYGKVETGPNSTVVVGGSVAIGDTNWIDGPPSHTGIEAGYNNNDLNIPIPDAPTNNWTVAPGTSKTMPSITHNSTTNTLLSSGPGTTNIYTTASAININNITTLRITNAAGVTGGTIILNAPSMALANSGLVAIAPGITFILNTTATTGLSLGGSMFITNMPGSNFILNAPGGMSVGNGTEIGVASNATFTAYVGGTTTINGAGWVNNGNATNVTIYGSTTSTNITVSNGGALVGTIYAPHADVSMTGGATFTGSVVGNSLTIQNGFTFHFDESLKSLLSSLSSYSLVSWNEISP